MSIAQKVAIVTGASQGIGAGILQALRDRNYRVVATSRSIKPVADSDVLTVQGDIGAADTAESVQNGLGEFRSCRHAGQQRRDFHGKAIHDVFAG